MPINNRDDANRYYQLINELIDDYIDKWKIRPSNLKKYLKPGSQKFKKFLERNKLIDIKGAEIILKDIIDDRSSMEKDNVLTFESFKIVESDEFKIKSLDHCLYLQIDKSTIQMEKILADYFDTNLGDIDVVDADKHIFRLKNWKGKYKVIIFSLEELNIILNNIANFLFDELSNKKISLTSNISIELSNLIKEDQFESKIKSLLNKEKIKDIISDILGEEWKFESELNKHFIWLQVDQH